MVRKPIIALLSQYYTLNQIVRCVITVRTKQLLTCDLWTSFQDGFMRNQKQYTEAAVLYINKLRKKFRNRRYNIGSAVYGTVIASKGTDGSCACGERSIMQRVDESLCCTLETKVKKKNREEGFSTSSYKGVTLIYFNCRNFKRLVLHVMYMRQLYMLSFSSVVQ